jgi:hypothetical protein
MCLFSEASEEESAEVGKDSAGVSGSVAKMIAEGLVKVSVSG